MNNLSKDKLIEMYEMMLRIRSFEEKVADLILEGEIRTPCHLYTGQEGVATGVCSALKQEDYVFGNHRSHGHYIAKGGSINALMAEIFCKETGCAKGKGGSMHIVAPEVGVLGTPPIVASSIPIAVGAALASSIREDGRVAVSFFGDGATSEGVFYESLNFAALRKLPVVFVCENNLYSTHMPIAKILSDTDISKKAAAFGMPGLRIEGNNVLEVFEAAKKAVDRARSGGGPTLIECLTYRWRGHVGPDDNIQGTRTDIRSKDEIEKWHEKCPIKSFERIMNLTEAEKNGVADKILKEIEESVKFAKESSYPSKEALQRDIFKIL